LQGGTLQTMTKPEYRPTKWNSSQKTTSSDSEQSGEDSSQSSTIALVKIGKRAKQIPIVVVANLRQTWTIISLLQDLMAAHNNHPLGECLLRLVGLLAGRKSLNS